MNIKAIPYFLFLISILFSINNALYIPRHIPPFTRTKLYHFWSKIEYIFISFRYFQAYTFRYFRGYTFRYFQGYTFRYFQGYTFRYFNYTLLDTSRDTLLDAKI